MSKNLKIDLFVFLLFVAFTLAVFRPVFLGKVNLNGHLLVSFYKFYGENLPYKDTGWDQLRIYFPFYKITFDSLRNFKLPFWNPYAFSGHPHFADFQTAVLYPLNIFGFFLSQIAFWHLLRITPSIFASFFTFLYLRNLKLSKIASFFGALAFGFSPFMVTWGEEVVMAPHSILFLPLILLAVDKLIEKFSRVFFLVLTLAIALSFLAGYLQTTIYLLVFTFTYFIFRSWSKAVSLGRKAAVIAGFLLGVCLSFVQLLPSAELFLNSARSGVDYSNVIRQFLLPPQALITYLAPDFFGNSATWNHFLGGSSQYYEAILFAGIAPLIFAFVAISKRKNLLTLFLLVWVVISLLTVIDTPISRLFVSLPIPLISTAIPNRVLFLPAFAIVVLGAIGMDYWLAQKKEKLLRIILLVAFLYFAVIFYLAAVKVLRLGFFGLPISNSQRVLISLRNLVIPVGIFGLVSIVIIFIRSKKLAAIFVVLITVLHIFLFASKYLSFSDKKYVFPRNEVLDYIVKNQGQDRTLFVGDRLFANNFYSQFGILNPEGYDSLNNKAYSKFVFEAQKLPESQIVLRRSDAELGFKDQLGAAFADENKRRLLNILGIRYLVAKGEDRKDLAGSGYKSVLDWQDLAVFENHDAYPRAFISSNIKTLDRQGIKGEAKIISYEPWQVLVSVDSPERSNLVLTDNYYNGWTAKVDGVKANIIKADAPFRAVPVSVGKHIVEFYFDSDVFKIGLAVSAVSLVMLVCLACLSFKRYTYKS